MNHKYFEENIEGSKMSKKSPSRDNLEINKIRHYYIYL